MNSALLESPFSKRLFPYVWNLGDAKVLRTDEIRRPIGFSIPGEKALSVTLEVEGRTATGFGEGEEELAYKRAYSEALERLALFSFCARTEAKESSNGWAAHTLPALAIDAAILELIERDVALTAWENGGPFYVLPDALWPSILTPWHSLESRRAEYSDLKLLLTHSENGAAISALLFNGRGNCVAGHGSSVTIEGAIRSAVNECFRAAHAALRFANLSDVFALHLETDRRQRFEPSAHSLAYAYREPFPAEVRVEPISEAEALGIWERHRQNFLQLDRAALDIILIDAGTHVVARVKSPRYRQIYWGRCPDVSKPNQRPHFVG